MQKAKSKFVVLLYQIAEGEHTGTTLRQWLQISDFDGKIASGSKYYEQCGVALGGEIASGENLDPEVVFVSKTFVVEAGYRLTVGGKASPLNAATKKDDRDFLRIHRITEVL